MKNLRNLKKVVINIIMFLSVCLTIICISYLMFFGVHDKIQVVMLLIALITLLITLVIKLCSKILQ